MKTKQLLARHIRARHRTVGNRLQSSRFMNSKVSCVNRPVLLSPYKTASAKTPKRKRQWDSISNEPSLFLDLNYSSKAVQTWRFDFLPAIVFYLYFIIFFSESEAQFLTWSYVRKHGNNAESSPTSLFLLVFFPRITQGSCFVTFSFFRCARLILCETDRFTVFCSSAQTFIPNALRGQFSFFPTGPLNGYHAPLVPSFFT